jgi:hypothetical protein
MPTRKYKKSKSRRYRKFRGGAEQNYIRAGPKGRGTYNDNPNLYKNPTPKGLFGRTINSGKSSLYSARKYLKNFYKFSMNGLSTEERERAKVASMED